jgi:hypothetical protein
VGRAEVVDLEARRIQVVEHAAKHIDPLSARRGEGEPEVVPSVPDQRSGGGVESRGIRESQPDVATGYQAFEFVRRAVGDDATPVEHRDTVGETVRQSRARDSLDP